MSELGRYHDLALIGHFDYKHIYGSIIVNGDLPRVDLVERRPTDYFDMRLLMRCRVTKFGVDYQEFVVRQQDGILPYTLK